VYLLNIKTEQLEKGAKSNSRLELLMILFLCRSFQPSLKNAGIA